MTHLDLLSKLFHWSISNKWCFQTFQLLYHILSINRIRTQKKRLGYCFTKNLFAYALWAQDSNNLKLHPGKLTWLEPENHPIVKRKIIWTKPSWAFGFSVKISEVLNLNSLQNLDFIESQFSPTLSLGIQSPNIRWWLRCPITSETEGI